MTALLDPEVLMPLEDETGKRFLFCHFEGGGNTPPMLAVARRLVAQGHAVRVLSDPCNREECEAIGASFVSWDRAPARADKTPESDPMRDWEARNPPAAIRKLCEHVFVGTALARAQDTLAALNGFPADVIVTSEMLFGPMIAAEAMGIPCAALAANVYLYPLPGVPPFGPGFQPAAGWVGRVRDRIVQTMTLKLIGKYTARFNDARRALGLDPIGHVFDQIERVDRVLVQTSRAFDFPAEQLPRNVSYVGPEIDDPDWVQPWVSPWAADDHRPLVLVSFSTTFQNQADSLARVITALWALDVRAVVTAGPSIDLSVLPSANNVHVCRSAPHNRLLSEAALVITHCGHGTVIRSLAAGVPLVCMPMGRDQNDNAARVAARHAGVRIGPKATVGSIRRAVSTVLHDPSYRKAAQSLGACVEADARNSTAVEVLQELATAPHGELVKRHAELERTRVTCSVS